jgi:hypothetical protein
LAAPGGSAADFTAHLARRPAARRLQVHHCRLVIPPPLPRNIRHIARADKTFGPDLRRHPARAASLSAVPARLAWRGLSSGATVSRRSIRTE